MMFPCGVCYNLLLLIIQKWKEVIFFSIEKICVVIGVFDFNF